MTIKSGRKLLFLLIALISFANFTFADMAFGPEIFVITGVALIAILGIILGINFLINKGIIALLIFVFKGHMSTDKHPDNKKVIYITIAGLFTDIIVLGAIQIFSIFTKFSGYPLIILQGFFIAIFIAAIAYFFLFKKLLTKNESIFASILFGIISNPFWFLLYRMIVS